MSKLRAILKNIYLDTVQFRKNVIKETLNKYGPYENFLDVGCWNGETIIELISKTKIKNLHGIEPVIQVVAEANSRSIKTKSFFVDKDEWEYPDNYFDCIHSSEVVEHLSNVDFFLENAFKKLKPGGYFITTTNNLAAFHNIFSLLFGWAPFDLTNASTKSLSVGNPISIHKNEALSKEEYTWTHRCIYTPYWLKSWMELYNFEFIEFIGSGFYPFPPFLGSIFKNHAAFFTIVMKKK